ncbi:AMP-dependent synthetase/ligase [Isoptericola sp. NEAU-Y5]|uniref:Acyl-CoA synthetase n=1 Tax=Isoptericola luteus TaxID=2879484 RepID=A0ABS7ZEG9_9MICO|nr:AMP-dependent synthetase/ligase [Isoptericola sp. NEAU-Y5]MCA5893308.1 AMP-dependent synthetase/ligase [Isoptericola sp. NEAU-Y5]
MPHATTPSLVDVPEDASINTLLADRVARAGSATLLERQAKAGGEWLPVSAAQFDADVLAVGRGLVAHGVEVGDRVAIMSRTRYEWTLLDFALWAVGAVPVPVYETSSPEQVHWILSDAGVRLAVVETPAHADAVRHVRDRLPHLEDVLVLAGGAVRELREAGETVTTREVVARREAVRGDDLATVVYTSGSTGRPKGAELTHGNFTHVVMNARLVLPELLEADGARTVLFLPLAHVFARLIQLVAIGSGTVLGHLPDVKTLVDDLGTFRPTYLLAVPRVFEKVYNSAEQKAGHGARRRLFRWSARVSGAYSRALEAGPVPLSLRARHRVADALVLRRLRAAMGGRLTYAISGGAPLGDRLGHFFRGAGVTILEGYGLTETTAPTSVNLPSDLRIGTVGPPLPGTSVRVTDDGEVLVRGPHVFRGYRGRPDLTADAVVDGWFRTGDLGVLDDGHLRITGRTKEIIVTAGGKNVAPAPLEDRLRAHPIVSQVVVVGDRRPFVGALVTLDAEMLPGWLAMEGLPPMRPSEARTDERVLAALDAAATEASAGVSQAESIRKIRVLEGDFSEANGYLTPSLKVRRTAVVRDFAADVDALYAR